MRNVSSACHEDSFPQAVSIPRMGGAKSVKFVRLPPVVVRLL